MIHDQLAHVLPDIDRENYRVLKLLPLVYVAWADGEMDAVRKQRITALAHDHFAVGRRGEAVLRRWLEAPPSRAYVMAGLHEIYLLAHASDEWEFDLDDLQGLLIRAEGIARATSRALDDPTAVSTRAERALAEIARELETEDGQTWARLLADLGEDAPIGGPAATAPVPARW